MSDTHGLDGSAASGMAERPPAVEGAEPTAITWYSDADAPAMIAYSRAGRAFVNAYTGELRGRGSDRVRGMFTLVTDRHRLLARTDESRDTGRAITGAANLGFLFIVISGFYLWWPRNWTRAALRNITLFRGGLSGKVRDNVTGFWSLVPLFIIVFSGVMISYPWATALVYRIAGDTPPPPAGAARPALQPRVEHGQVVEVGPSRRSYRNRHWLAPRHSGRSRRRRWRGGGASARLSRELLRHSHIRSTPATAVSRTSAHPRAESRDRRDRAVGALFRGSAGTTASQLPPLPSYGRGWRPPRADARGDNLRRRGRARVDGFLPHLAAIPRRERSCGAAGSGQSSCRKEEPRDGLRSSPLRG